LITGDAAAEALARVDALHTALTHIVLEGGDLDQIAAEAAAVLDVGVVFTSTDGRERAGSLTQAHRQALDRARLLDDTGRVRVERIGESGSTLDADPDRADPAGEVRSLRVAAGGSDLARLVFLRLGGDVSEEDVHALERVAIVAALLITRQSAVSAVENKYQGDFLRDLLLRGSAEEAYVEEHLQAFGWRLDRPVVVVVAEIDPQPRDEPPASRDQRRTWQERFSAAWRQVSQSFDQTVPSVDFSSEVVTLLPVAADWAPAPSSGGTLADIGAEDTPVASTWAGHDVVRRVVTGVAGDKGGGRRSFSVGVSRVAPGIRALPEAYAQARRSV
jgi:purine catabolism regulator